MSLNQDDFEAFKAFQKLIVDGSCPETGMPWLSKQTPVSMWTELSQEVQEIKQAVRDEDWDELKLELADLLFHVFFYSNRAAEAGHFTLSDVIRAGHQKYSTRWQGVLGVIGPDGSAAEERRIIRANKQKERAAKAQHKGAAAQDAAPHSAMDGLCMDLPALELLEQLISRAQMAGFFDNEPKEAYSYFTKEVSELVEEMLLGDCPKKLFDESADVLFMAGRWAKSLDVSPESAVKYAICKFIRRFRQAEQLAADAIGYEAGKTALTAAQWELFWKVMKQHNDTPGPDEQWYLQQREAPSSSAMPETALPALTAQQLQKLRGRAFGY